MPLGQIYQPYNQRRDATHYVAVNQVTETDTARKMVAIQHRGPIIVGFQPFPFGMGLVDTMSNLANTEFETRTNATWTKSYAQINATGSAGSISTYVNGTSTSQFTWDLTGSQFVVECEPTLDPEQTQQYHIGLFHSSVRSNDIVGSNDLYFRIYYIGGSWKLEPRCNGYAGSGGSFGSYVTYNATNHRFLRIRESSGTVYWDTSANGLSWNNLISETLTNLESGRDFQPIAIQRVGAICYLTNVDTNSSMKIHNVNVIPRGKIETLVENFNSGFGIFDNDATYFSNPDGTYLINGKVAVDSSGIYSQPNGDQPKYSWDLKGSSIYFQAIPSLDTSPDYFLDFQLKISYFSAINGYYYIQIYYDGISAHTLEFGYLSGAATSTNYDSVNHKWLRMRFASNVDTTGNVYLDGSPDGINWSNIYTRTTSSYADVNYEDSYLEIYSTSATQVLIDNINTPPLLVAVEQVLEFDMARELKTYKTEQLRHSWGTNRPGLYGDNAIKIREIGGTQVVERSTFADSYYNGGYDDHNTLSFDNGYVLVGGPWGADDLYSNWTSMTVFRGKQYQPVVESSFLINGGKWDLKDSYLYMELDISEMLTTEDVYIDIAFNNNAYGIYNNQKVGLDGQFAIQIDYIGGVWKLQTSRNWFPSSPLFSTNYDSVNHRWIKVRESGGTLYVDTSPNGILWSNLTSWTPKVYGTSNVPDKIHSDYFICNYIQLYNYYGTTRKWKVGNINCNVSPAVERAYASHINVQDANSIRESFSTAQGVLSNYGDPVGDNGYLYLDPPPATSEDGVIKWIDPIYNTANVATGPYPVTYVADTSSNDILYDIDNSSISWRSYCKLNGGGYLWKNNLGCGNWWRNWEGDYSRWFDSRDIEFYIEKYQQNDGTAIVRVLTYGLSVFTDNVTTQAELDDYLWLRLRASSGVIYVDRSANGQSWTNFASYTLADKDNPNILPRQLTWWGTNDGSPDPPTLDNINTIGVDIGQTSETDTAQSISISPIHRFVATAVEHDITTGYLVDESGQYVLDESGNRIVIEGGLIGDITAIKTVAIGQANETDTASAVNRVKTINTGQAVENDSGWYHPITAHLRKGKIKTLIETFDTDLGRFENAVSTGSSAVWSAGKMFFEVSTPDWTDMGLDGALGSWDLTNSNFLFKAEIDFDTSGATTPYIQFDLFNTNEDIWFFIYRPVIDDPPILEIGYNKRIGDIMTSQFSDSITFNTLNHIWFRFRENSGTIYWDVSSNGLSWTNLGSCVHSGQLDILTPFFQIYDDNTPDTTLYIDNINNVIVPISQVSETDTAQSVTVVKTVLVNRATETDSASIIRCNKVYTAVEYDSTTGYLLDEDGEYILDGNGNKISSGSLIGDIVVLKTVAIGQASETDTAQALAKRILVDQASETDTAQTITPFQSGGGGQTISVDQVSETDTAILISPSIGQASEADTAQTISVNPYRRLIDIASETDTSQAVASNPIYRFIDIASETDTAQTITENPNNVFVDQITENDTAQTITPIKVVLADQATETDTAQEVLQTIRVVQATEIDTSQSISVLKTVSVVQTTETDEAQTITPTVANQIGQASETDTAQTVTSLKTQTVGQSSETDTSQAIAVNPIYRLINIASETDTAQTITENPNNVFVDQTTETDTAQTISVNPIYRLIGQATETDSAQVLSSLKTQTVVQTTETDTAQTITSAKNMAIGQTTETDTAQATSVNPYRRLVDIASETDTANGVTENPNNVFVDQVVETDTAQTVSINPQRRLVSIVTETDTSQVVSVNPIYRLIGMATETDTAISISAAGHKYIDVDQVIETDTANAVTENPNYVFTGQTSETDSAQAITSLKTVAIVQTSETDNAQAVTSSKIRTVAQTTETDTAQAITSLKAVAFAQVTETDTAQAISVNPYRRLVGQTTETDTAQVVSVSYGAGVQQALETDTAQAITPLKTVAVVQSSETDSAQSISTLKTQTIVQVTETDTAQTISVNPQRRLVGQTIETDTAQGVSVNPIYRFVDIALETDTANGVVENPNYVLVGQATETDTAQNVDLQAQYVINQATETDSAQTISVNPIYRLINIASEVDEAQNISSNVAHPVGQTTESDTAQSVSVKKTITVVQVQESDLAQSVSSSKVKSISGAQETDSGQSITAVKSNILGQSQETDTANAVGYYKTQHVGQITEINLGLTISPQRAYGVTIASETALSGSLSVIKTGHVIQATESDTSISINRLKEKLLGISSETDTASILESGIFVEVDIEILDYSITIELLDPDNLIEVIDDSINIQVVS